MLSNYLYLIFSLPPTFGMEFAKVSRKCFSANMSFSTNKNDQPSYVCALVCGYPLHMRIHVYVLYRVPACGSRQVFLGEVEEAGGNELRSFVTCVRFFLLFVCSMFVHLFAGVLDV